MDKQVALERLKNQFNACSKHTLMDEVVSFFSTNTTKCLWMYSMCDDDIWTGSNGHIFIIKEEKAVFWAFLHIENITTMS